MLSHASSIAITMQLEISRLASVTKIIALHVPLGTPESIPSITTFTST